MRTGQENLGSAAGESGNLFIGRAPLIELDSTRCRMEIGR